MSKALIHKDGKWTVIRNRDIRVATCGYAELAGGECEIACEAKRGI